MHKFTWKDIDENFIERKLRTRNLANGRDYYEFDYGYKDWKNITNGGEVYKENAERWNLLAPFVEGSVLDLGCNEGYISLQLARKGYKVVGIDHEWIQVAWLNKLIFEWIDKKTLPVKFIEGKIEDYKGTADTVLFLNVLYHLPREKQKEIVMRHKGRLIFQCNLRKEKVRNEYYTSHPDDLLELLASCGRSGKVIAWRDKPLVICE
jgi:2-polyprenyl-3-methyl-5-hydroxy-6-metoxy-1,4-benzoquinol methylase